MLRPDVVRTDVADKLSATAVLPEPGDVIGRPRMFSNGFAQAGGKSRLASQQWDVKWCRVNVMAQ